MADSMKVVILYDIDVPEYYGFNNMVLSRQPLTEALVKDGTFEVSGHVDGPALAYIIFCDARVASFSTTEMQDMSLSCSTMLT